MRWSSRDETALRTSARVSGRENSSASDARLRPAAGTRTLWNSRFGRGAYVKWAWDTGFWAEMGAMDARSEDARAVRPRRWDNKWWTSRAYECRDRRAVAGRGAAEVAAPCYPIIHRRDVEGAGGCAAMAPEDMITAQASLGMSGALLISRVRPCDDSAAAPTPSTFP